MTRKLLETEEIDKEHLDGVIARLEKNSYRSSRTNYEEMDAELHLNYTLEHSVENEKWTGQICVEVYNDYFQARGDEFLINQYFANPRIKNLEV